MGLRYPQNQKSAGHVLKVLTQRVVTSIHVGRSRRSSCRSCRLMILLSPKWRWSTCFAQRAMHRHRSVIRFIITDIHYFCSSGKETDTTTAFLQDGAPSRIVCCVKEFLRHHFGENKITICWQFSII